jgi:hypothetical protein
VERREIPVVSSINKGYAGGVLPNTFNSQAPVTSGVGELLGRLFPQDQVTLSAAAKLMSSIADVIAHKTGTAAERNDVWAKLQELSASDASQPFELWANNADPTAPGTTYGADVTQFTAWGGARYVSGYNEAVVAGSGGADKIYAQNDALVSAGDGDDEVYAKSSAVVSGGGGDDFLATGDKTVVSGGDGADQLRVQNDSVISGGNGSDLITAGDNDVISGGAGADWIFAGQNAVVSAGEGFDTITAGQNAMISAGDGADEITAGAGSTVEGGAGNDWIALGHHSTVIFGRGDGQDQISGFLRSSAMLHITTDPGEVSGYFADSTIQFREGVSVSDLTLTQNGDDLVIGISGTSDQMTIHGYSDKSNLTLAFADGSSVDLASMPRAQA